MTTMRSIKRAGWCGPYTAALLALGHYLKQADYRFTTVTPATHARINQRAGNELGSTLTDLFGWNRVFAESAVESHLFSLMLDADILERSERGWRSKLRAATLNGELYFHSAYPTAAVDSVFFGPDSYRFAALLEQELDNCSLPPQRVVDIGCGAGPGALTVAKRLPAAEVIAADINPSALVLCRTNTALAAVGNVTCCESNLLHEVNGEFDLIIANPPYLVDADQRAYRHGGGALGGALSLAIAEAALGRLRSGGTLMLYSGSVIVNGDDALLHEIERLLEAWPQVEWRYRELDPDIFGEELEHGPYTIADRIAAVALTLTRRG